MLLIWKGKGILVLLPAILLGLGAALAAEVLPIATQAANGIGLALGAVAAALIVHYFDRWLERRNPPRHLVDRQTGQTVIVKRQDSLFWVPMRFFPHVYAALVIVGILIAVTA